MFFARRTRCWLLAVLLAGLPLGGVAGALPVPQPSPLLGEMLADATLKIEEIVCVELPNNASFHGYDTFGYRANLAKPAPTEIGDQEGRRELILAAPPSSIPMPEKTMAGGPPLLRQPRPLIPRPREPVLSRAAEPDRTTGRLFVADVYHGRGAAGIRRGEIKRIMAYELLPHPIQCVGVPGQISVSSAWNIKRLLGTFPVEEDGSAYVEVPALRAIQLLALDAEGLGIKRMHAFTSVMPGETQSCSGCHEPRTETPGGGSFPLALQRLPSQPDRGDLPEIIDYPRDIQPIWDRHCVRCHSPEQMQGKLDLSGHLGGRWSHSAYNLIINGYVRSTGARGPANPPPRSMGSPASPLTRMLDGRPYDVYQLDRLYYERQYPATLGDETDQPWNGSRRRNMPANRNQASTRGDALDACILRRAWDGTH